jgi:UDP-glucose 4-epimerase
VRGANLVFHLAAQATVMGAVQDLDYSFSTNVVGTFNVLRESATAGVRRVVFASSREVYGEPIELPVDEGQPLLAINFYGASKVVGEAYCRAFRRASGLDSVILRIANVYGPRDYGRVIPHWVEQSATGADLQVYGGKQVLDFVWVGQVVDTLLSAAASDVALPPINVGSGTGTKLMDLARRIRLLSGGRGQIQVVPARAVEVVQYIARIDRMRQLLHIEPLPDSLLHLDKLIQSPVAAAALR